MHSCSFVSFLSLVLLGCSDPITGEGGYAGAEEGDVFELFPGVVGAGGGLDSDADGLSDNEEADWGADPNNPDSDNDGYLDGEEVLGNTDPMDADDHPYAGGWPIDGCRNDVQATGNEIGDVANSFKLMDQNGDTVRLHDFCERTVLLISSAEWCDPCREEAPIVGNWYDTYADMGLMVITLLTENNSLEPPSQGVLNRWAEDHDLNHPVVADNEWDVTSRYIDSESMSIPTMHLMRRGLVIEVRDGMLTRSDIERMVLEDHP
jgi:peroxiredoxin